jgi:hypothetical protein
VFEHKCALAQPERGRRTNTGKTSPATFNQASVSSDPGLKKIFHTNAWA